MPHPLSQLVGQLFGARESVSAATGRSQDPDPDVAAAQERARLTAAVPVTDQETQLVRFVQKRFDVARTAKTPRYETWETCRAFFEGEHYRQWVPNLAQMIRNDDHPTWRVRITDNQITRIALSVASKRAQARHITIGIPQNPRDPEDAAAAALATKLLRHLDRICDRGVKRMELELLSTIYGTAFMMPYWDHRRSTQVAFVNPMTGDVSGQEAWIGDVDWEVLDPWMVFPMPARHWREVQWCVVARTRSLEWVRATFGERGMLVAPDAAEADLYAGVDRAAYSGAGSPSHPATGDGSDHARVLEFYERRSHRYPAGRWLIVAGGRVLHYEEALPSPRGAFPIIPYVGIPVPGSIWGKGWLQDLIDQQRELNRVESQIIECKNLMARPKMAVARESKIDEDALHSGPGEIVEYSAANGAPPPQPISMPPLPAYMGQMPEQIVARMDNIAGVRELSAGTGDGFLGGVTSGVAIDLANQQAEDRLALPVAFAGQALKELDQQLLELCQEHYTVPRLIRVLGRDQDDEAIAFLGTDLLGNTEVGFDEVSSVTDSTAALRQRVMDYRNQGILDPLGQAISYEQQIDVLTLMNEGQIADVVRGWAKAAEQAAQAAAEQQAAHELGQELGEQLGADLDGDGVPDPLPPGMAPPDAPMSPATAAMAAQLGQQGMSEDAMQMGAR